MGIVWTVPQKIPIPQSNTVPKKRAKKSSADPEQQPQPSQDLSKPQDPSKPQDSSNPQDQAPQDVPKPQELKKEDVKGVTFDQETGQAILPVKLGSHTVECLGVISQDPIYHTERHIFPIGFRAFRAYQSAINPNTITNYTSSIKQGDSGPIFEVFPHDDPSTVYSSLSASGAWGAAIKGFHFQCWTTCD